MVDFDAIPDQLTWNTVIGHPVSGLRYQEAETSELGTLARIQQGGYEVVSPDTDTDAVYKQYWSRVDRYTDPQS